MFYVSVKISDTNLRAYGLEALYLRRRLGLPDRSEMMPVYQHGYLTESKKVSVGEDFARKHFGPTQISSMEAVPDISWLQPGDLAVHESGPERVVWNPAISDERVVELFLKAEAARLEAVKEEAEAENKERWEKHVRERDEWKRRALEAEARLSQEEEAEDEAE